MITVTVAINGFTIIARSARRTPGDTDEESVNAYLCDDGRTIMHRYGDGGAKLAIKLLESVRDIG